MSFFTNPTLLAGFALIAVPIILHLLMRRRPRRIEFPALQLILLTREKTRRRLQIQHLLLLLLRTVAILFLVLVLARPQLPGDAGKTKLAVAMVFDVSPHMHYTYENETRLKVAQELGRKILTQLPQGCKIAVEDNRKGTGGSLNERGDAGTRIDRLGMASNPMPLAATIIKALRLLSNPNFKRRELYIFTDLSRASWPPASSELFQSVLSTAGPVTIYLVDVGVEKPNNMRLGALELVPGQILSEGETLTIKSNVVNQGPAAETEVELFLLGKKEREDYHAKSLSENGLKPVEFILDQLSLGTHQGMVRLTHVDTLMADNVRFFTFEVRKPRSVLVVAPGPPSERGLFLRAAIESPLSREHDKASLAPEVIGYPSLQGRPLSNYSCVFLLDPPPLEPGLWNELGDYVVDGGGLGIILGREARRPTDFHNAQADRLLPGRLVRQARAPGDDVFLTADDFEHPILETLARFASKIPFSKFPVFRYWQLKDLAEGVGVVMRYSDGRPAMLERSIGKGRVVTMTTPFSDPPSDPDAWNQLTDTRAGQNAIIFNRLAYYLARDDSNNMNITSGQDYTTQISKDDPSGTYQLFDPDGKRSTLSPGSTTRRIEASNKEPVGNYQIQRGGTKGFNKGFSVNYRPEATNLSRINNQELDAFFGKHPYRKATDREQLIEDQEAGRADAELFPTLLVLLLAIILAAEQVVSNRFYNLSGS